VYKVGSTKEKTFNYSPYMRDNTFFFPPLTWTQCPFCTWIFSSNALDLNSHFARKNSGIIRRRNVRGHAVEKYYLATPSCNFSVYKENVPSLFLPQQIEKWYLAVPLILFFFVRKSSVFIFKKKGFLRVLSGHLGYGLSRQVIQISPGQLQAQFLPFMDPARILDGSG
jgi:hypothetical protein